MTETRARQIVADYEAFDFRALWRGREKVTAVERAVLSRALRGIDGRRLLEVGAGFGRLSDCLTTVGDQVFEFDFDATALAGIPPPKTGQATVTKVAGNLYHLPFTDGAFTGASMIRVFHHLTDPAAALGELARVLRVGARLVISYSPRPSVGTFVNDVHRALRRTSTTPFVPATFSRGGWSQVEGLPFPVLAGTCGQFNRLARSADFEIEKESVTGLEEFRLLRWLPERWFVDWADEWSRTRGFPNRFVQLRLVRARDHSESDRDDVLACPRCRTAFDSREPDRAMLCPSCGFEGKRHDGVVDLRYVPPGIPRTGPNAQ